MEIKAEEGTTTPPSTKTIPPQPPSPEKEPEVKKGRPGHSLLSGHHQIHSGTVDEKVGRKDGVYARNYAHSDASSDAAKWAMDGDGRREGRRYKAAAV